MHIQTAKGRETKKQTLLPSLVDRPPSCASAARDDEGDGHVLRGRLVGLAGPDGDVARGPGRPLLPPSPPQGGCEPPAGGRGGGRGRSGRVILLKQRALALLSGRRRGPRADAPVAAAARMVEGDPAPNRSRAPSNVPQVMSTRDRILRRQDRTSRRRRIRSPTRRRAARAGPSPALRSRAGRRLRCRSPPPSLAEQPRLPSPPPPGPSQRRSAARAAGDEGVRPP